MLGIGIDTGGTCTDAVIYDLTTREVLGSGKALTTKSNLEIGIANALDTLPQERMNQVGTISLSTTLATNACVENKGARAKLLMIGFEETMVHRLKDVYASYGLTDLSQFIILEAKPENLFSDAFDPDWEELRNRAWEYFGDCDAIGIVQMFPRANGHRFELTARQILQEVLPHPITISYDIARETDILKTCVGTLLNARLIPLIEEFMEAVHHVMEQRGLHVPISIVRSDGSLMSEQMAMTCPVETLLCGPTASVLGSSELAREPESMVIDMGGTTTDIAVVRKDAPVMATRGVHIGQWTTMVQGIYVSTFCLGGDTAIRFRDGQIYLDTVRVIPLSILAETYDFVVPELRHLAENPRVHAKWIYEYYVLQKDISGKSGYTEDEQEICALLKDRPLITWDLAEKLHRDPYFIRIDRLERDGVIMKAGLTPTDLMILRGDFPGKDPEAAKLAVFCFGINLVHDIEQLPDRIYEMVIRRMYKNIGKVLFEQEYPKKKMTEEALEEFLDFCYEQATARAAGEETLRFGNLILSTDLTLVGVGAPIHVFLPEVAKLFGAKVVIPPYAGVANAVGAISGRIVNQTEVVIKPFYQFGCIEEFRIIVEGKVHAFKKYEDAEPFAIALAKKLLQRKNALQGIAEDAAMEISIRQDTVGAGILYQTFVEARTIRSLQEFEK